MSALLAAVAIGIGVGLVTPGAAGCRRLHLLMRRRGPARATSTPRHEQARGGRVPAARVSTERPLARRVWVGTAPSRRHWLAGGLLAVCLVGLFGIPWGVGFGVLAAVLVPRLLGRLEPASVRRRRARVVADLPLSVDLLAGCLRAGRPAGDSLAVVAAAVGGPLGALFAEVDARLRLGADPADAWGLLGAEPACTPLARAIRRAVRSGAPLADTLEQLAADVRQERRWSADERARAVEARSVVPLGLCFLPAFVLIGIVPTVAGGLSGVFEVFGGSG